MKVGKKRYRTVWFEKNKVFFINQSLLPFKFKIRTAKNFRETAEAIRSMKIRGAPAIGAAAGFAMAQAFLSNPSPRFVRHARRLIESTRPTAADLFNATNRVFEACLKTKNPGKAAVEEAQRIADESVAACKRIGVIGARLVKKNARVLTHCNAGWLACVDWGTALAPVYAARRAGRKPFVFVDETRPKSQGAKLTAWELANEGVSHAVIVDNASAFFLSRGEIDLVLVGADRVAANGDFANKIGTLEKAIAARHYKIPFYAVAPLSSFDFGLKNGRHIPIEERSPDEVLYAEGLVGRRMQRVRVVAPRSKVCNPVFDVTPASLVTGFVTERGIVRKPNAQKLCRLRK